jgi:NAD(P)H-quinone oxidoreductase subunit K
MSSNLVVEQTSSRIINPVAQPEVPSQLSENIILANLNDVYNWARLSSLYPLMFGTACCFMEFAALIASRFDVDRFGVFPRMSPRQADLIITAGTITMKMAPALVRLYEQMPEPKYVMAMGACTITGGMFSTDSYSAVRGVDKLIPVDVYIPGCPPRPEAIMDAIVKLRKKISSEALSDREQTRQTHRYHSLSHQMKSVPVIHDGRYLETASRQAPPRELEMQLGMPMPEIFSGQAVEQSAIGSN